ncbi:MULTISPECIES: hypothetical protein [unclassified Tardiphaga]|uniref:hypothetical protein n=1 Tax=unclassified Tardiphaga TaxID=2631404 RepID=UPI00143D910E|nr:MULTISPECIES: hypothetical protein [unclassified Tardiphaga]
MRPADDFRNRAVQFTRQAAAQADADDASRLLSIASYWFRLADAEEWSIERPTTRTEN